MIKLITTFFYTGLLKPAPGTWGSAAAVVTGIILHGLGGFPLLAVATVAVTVIGLWATAKALETSEDKDP